jgi:hypothetical protein
LYIEPSTITTPDGVERHLDVYPVGIFRDFINSRRLKKLGKSKKYQLHLNDIRVHIRKKEWHSIKSTFNGYLAELDPWPENMQCCGTGWTRRRAVRDIQRGIRKARMWDGQS